MALTNLPKTIQEYCIEFLALRDALNFGHTNKIFKKILENHPRYWIYQCINVMISFDIGLTSPFYQDVEYEKLVKKRISALKNANWLKDLKVIYQIRKILQAKLAQATSDHEASYFLEFLDSSLREPSLPPLTLQKENSLTNRITFFQSRLLDVSSTNNLIFETSQMSLYSFDLLSCCLKYFQSNLARELTSREKDVLMRIRWYHDPCELESFIADLDTPAILPEEAEIAEINGFGVLEKIYSGLYFSFVLKCRVTRNYLKAFENDPYMLLSEYTTRWNSYVASIIEIETSLDSLPKHINQLHKQNFPHHPQNPEFSFWRLMTRLWFREVFESITLAKYLDEAFAFVSKSVCLDSTLAVCELLSESEQEEVKFSSFKLPKHAYLDMHNSKYTGINGDDFFGNSISQDSREFFKSRKDLHTRLLKDYVQMILDISLNEITIHSLERTDVKFSLPYQELETTFLKELRTSYLKLQELLQKYPRIFRYLFEKSGDLVKEIFPKSTQFACKKMQIADGLAFMSQYTREFILSIDFSEIVQEKPSGPKNLKHPLFSFIEDAILEIYKEGKLKYKGEELTKDSQLASELFSEEVSTNKSEESAENLQLRENLAPRLLQLMELEYPQFKEDYEFWFSNCDGLKSFLKSDLVIKQINTLKKIPNELSDTELLFYELDRDADITLITNFSSKKLQISPESKDNCN